MDAGEGGEAFVVELLEGGQVGGDDTQEVVGLTEEPLGLPNVTDGGDGEDGRSPCAVSKCSPSKAERSLVAAGQQTLMCMHGRSEQ